MVLILALHAQVPTNPNRRLSLLQVLVAHLDLLLDRHLFLAVQRPGQDSVENEGEATNGSLVSTTCCNNLVVRRSVVALVPRSVAEVPIDKRTRILPRPVGS